MKRCPNFACTVFASHNSRGAGFYFWRCLLARVTDVAEREKKKEKDAGCAQRERCTEIRTEPFATKNQGVFNKSRSYRQCIVVDKTSDRLMFSLWAGSHNWVSSCGPFPIKPSIKPPIKPSAFAYGKGVFETPENILFFEGAVVDRRLNSPKIARQEGIFLAAGLTLM